MTVHEHRSHEKKEFVPAKISDFYPLPNLAGASEPRIRDAFYTSGDITIATQLLSVSKLGGDNLIF